MRLNLTQHGALYRWKTPEGSKRDLAESGAWPLLARGVTCQVESANGRDPHFLFLEKKKGRPARSRRRAGDSRSVMPFEAAGCTRATVRAGGPRREARAERAAGDAGEGARAERGIPSTRGSPARGDSVPVLCTHRPSLSEMGARGKRGRA